MNSEQYGQYQAISKLYKEITDTLTSKDLAQVKLYIVNLEKSIAAKNKDVLKEFESVKNVFNSLK